MKNLQKDRGFVLLFTVILSSIFLAVALGVADIAFKELKFGTDARATNDAFFAADTGAECASYYNRLDINKFPINNDPATPIICADSSISVTKTVSLPTYYWNFVVPSLGSSNQSCAVVNIEKDTDPSNPSAVILTVITSKGYNVGDPTCSSTNPNRVERETQVTY